MEAQHVSIHGHDVSYRGGGSGPVVVLIHGMAGSSVTWEPVLPRAHRHYTVIAPDLPGHGDSDKPRGDYSLGAHASSIRDLLDRARSRAGHDRRAVVRWWRRDAARVPAPRALRAPGARRRAGDWVRRSRCCCARSRCPARSTSCRSRATARVRDAGVAVTGFFDRLGLRPVPAVAEMWRSFASLERRGDARGVPAHAALGRRHARPAGERGGPPVPRRGRADADRLGRPRPDHPDRARRSRPTR